MTSKSKPTRKPKAKKAKEEEAGRPRLLLLDGDVFCFIAAAAAQKDIHDPDQNIVIRWAHPDEGERILDNMVAKVLERLKAKDYLFFLTSDTNWRTQVLPTYKDNRVDTERPQILAHLKQYARKKYTAYERPGMEADDLLGIFATVTDAEFVVKDGRKKIAVAQYDRLIVTKDKDLRSIPGIFANLSRVLDTPGYIPEPISVEMADFWHMVQAFAGDKVDGYDGCPGIGMDRAQQILRAPVVLVPEEGVITRGKNKGKRTVKWVSRRTSDMWDCVLSHYQKNGLGEEDALVQARVARICRAEDYDFKSNQVKLWTPPPRSQSAPVSTTATADT